jgi:hypothetical protein
MFLHIIGSTMYSKRLEGLRARRASDGGSVASARAAKVSMIRFTQSI